MPRLLVVAHLPAPSIRRLHDAVVAGAGMPGLEDVDVVARPALSADAEDVRAADGVVLGTTVNFGYVSGGLKDFFDRTYRAVRGERPRLPCAAFVKGESDATGALRFLDQVTTGLEWTYVADPLVVIGEVDDAALAAARELGATVAARLLLDG